MVSYIFEVKPVWLFYNKANVIFLQLTHNGIVNHFAMALNEKVVKMFIATFPFL